MEVLIYCAALCMCLACIAALFEGWSFTKALAQAAGALGLMRLLASRIIPKPDRAPGFYWVSFDRVGDGAAWFPGELLENGRWCYLGGQWTIREDELTEIGERIER